MIKFLVDVGMIAEEDGTCFDLEATAEYGTFILLTASVLLNVMSHIVSRLAVAAWTERDCLLRGAQPEKLTWTVERLLRCLASIDTTTNNAADVVSSNP